MASLILCQRPLESGMEDIGQNCVDHWILLRWRKNVLQTGIRARRIVVTASKDRVVIESKIFASRDRNESRRVDAR